MTPSQKNLYFNLWREVTIAHDWRMIKGRLLATRPEAAGQAEADKLALRVWEAACALAGQAHRAITADDLRHACHIVAIGKDISSKVMTNKQLNRLFALFKFLKDPNNIAAAIAWENPEDADRKSLIIVIQRYAGLACTGNAEHHVDAYINEICKHRTDWPNYHEPHWEDLQLHQLRQLVTTLSNRARAKQAPIAPHVVPPLGGRRPQMVNVNRNMEEPF